MGDKIVRIFMLNLVLSYKTTLQVLLHCDQFIWWLNIYSVKLRIFYPISIYFLRRSLLGFVILVQVHFVTRM